MCARGGVASGASPQAYTFADAPSSADASSQSQGLFEMRWNWPDEVRVGRFDVDTADVHENANSQSDPFGPAGWYGRIAAVVATAVRGTSFTYRADAAGTAPHQFFWVRAVNVLGQRGFTTDLSSATDLRFVPHVSARYAPR